MQITRVLIQCVLVSALLPRAGVGQVLTGIPAVDSASVARAAWTRAAAALQRDDSSRARVEVTHAAASWPAQPSYVWARAVLAARAHDSTTALDALRHYAALGLGRDLRDATFDWLRTSADFASVLRSHDANAAPLVKSRVAASLPDSTFWPEGMDVDPRTQRFYVTSIRHRTIAEISPDGSVRELFGRDRADLGALLGVRVDPASGDLWVTSSPVRESPAFASGDTTAAELLRVRVSDGTIVRRWKIPPSDGVHTLGDLAVGPRGDVFITDSTDPALYVLRDGAESFEVIRSPLLRSPQGIAPSPDARVVYVADYSHGLLRVDLQTRAVTRLDDAPWSTSLGCDGIVWDRGAIVAVQNGVGPARVMRFVLDASGTRIARADVLDRNFAAADEPTIGAIVGREFVYVANSQWEKHDAAGRRVGSKPLARPLLLAVPLP